LLESILSLLPSSESEAFTASLGIHPRRSIRLRDDSQVSDLPFDVEPVAWNEAGFFLTDSECRPGGFVHYAAGCYYIQDAGSLLPISLLQPQPGELICDLCAAPGGKSTAILERMQGQGVLVANEPIRSRTNVLKYMLGRTGLPNYLTTELDPDRMAQEFAGEFDAVLVDAPCSGQMMVSRDKREANAWSSKQIEHSAARQQRILDAAIKLLKPGGRLVYSTCTFALEENEMQMRRLVQTFGSAFSPLCSPSLANWASPACEGCYRLWPHRDLCAGGFAGGLVLKEELPYEHVDAPNRRDRRKGKTSHKAHSGKKKQGAHLQLDLWAEMGGLGEIRNSVVRQLQDEIYIGTEETWQLLDRHNEVARPPLALIPVARRLEPSHTLALTRDNWFQSREVIELNDDQAVAYLSGESLRELTRLGNNPWTRVFWQRRPLGWGRQSNGQLKNQLPAWSRFQSLTSI
jgi:16S rRNA C967 or C1407 C5-methylase (RsmB/RsmF family)